MTIGERIAQLRERRGMDITDLASASGLSSSYISQIENGKRSNLTLSTLEALASGLGVTLSELVAVDAEDEKDEKDMLDLNDIMRTQLYFKGQALTLEEMASVRMAVRFMLDELRSRKRRS